MLRDTVAIGAAKQLSGTSPHGAAVLITGVFTTCKPSVSIPASNATVSSLVAGHFQVNAGTRITHEFRGAAPLCSCRSSCCSGGGSSAPLLITLVTAVFPPFTAVLIIITHPVLSYACSTGTPGWRGNRLQ